jgi:hypothetical protein
VCYEHDVDRYRDDEAALEDIRRLFERYRASGRREAEILAELADEAPAAEQEAVLASH